MKEKRLLAILSSPHETGNCGMMLNYMVEKAKEKGYHIDKIHLYEKKIGYCQGCRVCDKTAACVLQDDQQAIADLLKRCDLVILASPTYWANVAGIVKNMLDRLVGTAMQHTDTFPKARLSKKQTYILLTSCSTRAPFSWIFHQSRGSMRAMNEFFKTAGMKCGGKIVWSNTTKKAKMSPRLIKQLDHYWK